MGGLKEAFPPKKRAYTFPSLPLLRLPIPLLCFLSEINTRSVALPDRLVRSPLSLSVFFFFLFFFFFSVLENGGGACMW